VQEYGAQSGAEDIEELGFELLRTDSLGEIKLGTPMTSLLQWFGEPQEKSEAQIWGADEQLHQTIKYTALGLEFDMVSDGDSSMTVNMITATAGCTLKTAKGIGLGSTHDEVKAAYKKYISESASDEITLIAGSIYGGIVFGFEDKKVKSIFYGAGTE